MQKGSLKIVHKKIVNSIPTLKRIHWYIVSSSGHWWLGTVYFQQHELNVRASPESHINSNSIVALTFYPCYLCVPIISVDNMLYLLNWAALTRNLFAGQPTNPRLNKNPANWRWELRTTKPRTSILQRLKWNMTVLECSTGPQPGP